MQKQLMRFQDSLGILYRSNKHFKTLIRFCRARDHTAFVAEFENKVVGWIGAAQAIMIEVMPHCEINGLVIDEHRRGMGIGKLLIDKVKHWAMDKGNDKIGLHCNVKRTEAHLFYQHMGFTEIKQQKNFVINI